MIAMVDSTGPVTLNVNGIDYPVAVATARSLLSVLRSEIGLTGTKQGCDDCECGACIVLLDGQPVNACSYLAVQAQGRQIMTVEGLAATGSPGEPLNDLQAAILEAAGVQCGFCTPGMLMSATALLDRNPDPSREQIKIGLGGNLCRCTGYGRILEAVEQVVTLRNS